MLFVSYADTLNSMNFLRCGQAVICRESLPAEYEVRSVHNSPRSGGFMFTLYSESFDIVPKGEKAPSINPEMTVRSFKLGSMDGE